MCLLVGKHEIKNPDVIRELVINLYCYKNEKVCTIFIDLILACEPFDKTQRLVIWFNIIMCYFYIKCFIKNTDLGWNKIK